MVVRSTATAVMPLVGGGKQRWLSVCYDWSKGAENHNPATAKTCDIIQTLKANGFEYTWGNVTVKLAESYGFCWGVERAIQITYEAKKHFPEEKIWITNEIIHNPTVSKQFKNMNIEATYVFDYILGRELDGSSSTKEAFLEKFNNAVSKGFDPDTDLVKVGIANQTIMLKGEIEEIGKLAERTMTQECTHWQQKLNDPAWSPFKKVKEEIVDEEDVEIKKLGREMGVSVMSV